MAQPPGSILGSLHSTPFPHGIAGKSLVLIGSSPNSNFLLSVKKQSILSQNSQAKSMEKVKSRRVETGKLRKLVRKGGCELRLCEG